MNFDEARAEYNRLRQGYDNRQLSPDDFARQVQGLQVRDDSGTYWAIDGATGNWLRYDGQSWVPGQPPVAQYYTPPPAPTPTPSYGQDQTVVAGSAPQPGGYQPAGGGYQPAASGYAPAGGYGPQPGGYAGVAPAPAATAGARSRSKAKPIIFGCLGLAVVALLVCVGVVVVLSKSNSLSTVFDTTTGITDVVVAGSIDANNKPLDSASQFANGQKVYVTYTFKRMKAGQQVKFHVTRDGQPVELPTSSSTFTASEAATYNGVFEFTPARTGSYTVDLYIDDATTPDKTASFTVR